MFLRSKEFAIYADHKPLVRAFHSSHSQELVSYIKDSENFTDDAVSRGTINNVEYFQDGIDFELVNDANLEYFAKTFFLYHPDITALVNLIKKRFVWPNLKNDVTSWARTCLICLGNNSEIF